MRYLNSYNGKLMAIKFSKVFLVPYNEILLLENNLRSKWWELYGARYIYCGVRAEIVFF